MITLKKLALAAGVCAAALMAASTTFAQTTDAYHTIQVFPIVVDSGSFTQRFTFRNPNSTTLGIGLRYYPGTGTAQAAALSCTSIEIAPGSDKTFNTLRELCPGLAAGGNFGFLYTYAVNSTNTPYAGFSRVANPQGNGFSVEAFSAQTFTSASTVVAGVRRLAASGGNPAYQTNCFVANLNDWVPLAVPLTTFVEVTAFNSIGTQVGTTTDFSLTPGKLTRLVDVFAVVGAPAGDYDNARIRFFESGPGEPGLMTFCTVQDNTSFGADFRIGKQESNSDIRTNSDRSIGPKDDSAWRDSTISSDVTMNSSGTTPVTRAFEVGAGSFSSNTHVMYFRHPDWVQCEIINPGTLVRALAAYGLEMRMVASDGVTVLTGGNNSTGFGEIYLGDKRSRNNGANTRYTIEVEANGSADATVKPYKLHCKSGSGHTSGDMVRYQDASDRF